VHLPSVPTSRDGSSRGAALVTWCPHARVWSQSAVPRSGPSACPSSARHPTAWPAPGPIGRGSSSRPNDLRSMARCSVTGPRPAPAPPRPPPGPVVTHAVHPERLRRLDVRMCLRASCCRPPPSANAQHAPPSLSLLADGERVHHHSITRPVAEHDRVGSLVPTGQPFDHDRAKQG